MRPGPSSAQKLLPKYLNITAGPIRSREILARICLDQGWAETNDEAQEHAEKWEHNFQTRVQRELDELNRLGRHSIYVFNSSSGYLIQGAAFIEPIDSTEIQLAKQKRARHQLYAQQLSNLNARDFEALCAGILFLLGVEKPILTPLSGDEGIDFYGKLSLENQIGKNPAFSTFITQMSIWLIGQAKHYSASKVATPELRELVGSIHLAKSSTYATLNPKTENLSLRICDPVYYLFFTTGLISANGWRLIDRSGIIGMDGEMIAAFLADNDIGIMDDEFQPERFLAWIQQFNN